MADKWFESVAEAKRRAEKRLPPSVVSALRAGQEAGATQQTIARTAMLFSA